VSLDPQSHGHYIATDGKQREYSTFTRPLSWRVRGEECLVADRRALGLQERKGAVPIMVHRHEVPARPHRPES